MAEVVPIAAPRYWQHRSCLCSGVASRVAHPAVEIVKPTAPLFMAVAQMATSKTAFLRRRCSRFLTISRAHASTPPSPRHIAATINKLEALARSLRDGRTAKETTLDPTTARCARELTLCLSENKSAALTSLDLVRSASAFSRLRILHVPLLTALRAIPAHAWRSLSTRNLVDVAVAHATLQVEDDRLLQGWAGALVQNCPRLSMPPQSLANLAWAAATLKLGQERKDEFRHRLERAILATLQASRPLDGTQLARLAWSLGQLTNPQHAAADSATSGSLSRSLRAALQRATRPPSANDMGQLVWALSRLEGRQAARQLVDGAKAAGVGRDVMAALLRDAAAAGDVKEEVALWRRLAAQSVRSTGLKAAALNAAVIRCLAGRLVQEARQILEEMAAESLWTPVSFCLAERLKALEGSNFMPIEGKPAFPGIVNPGAYSHKYVRAAYYALGRAKPADIAGVLGGLEEFSRKKGWLKFGAADEKGDVIESELHKLLHSRKNAGTGTPLAIVEFGTFLGYSAMRMARLAGSGTRLVSFEMDPEVACLAMNLIAYAGMDDCIEVWVGQCEDLSTRLVEELGKDAVSFVYMDHNQITYHEDVARLEQLGVLSDGAVVVATQGLKPGAPLLLWRLVEAEKAGRCRLGIVSAPDCGCPLMEDWVVLAEMRKCDGAVWEPPSPPRELAFLATECNLMRWRTAKGLVDEKRWNGFVQYVRRGMERIAGVRPTREAWPERDVLATARSLDYKRLDY